MCLSSCYSLKWQNNIDTHKVPKNPKNQRSECITRALSVLSVIPDRSLLFFLEAGTRRYCIKDSLPDDMGN